jgi:hypothetical protein
MLGLTFL